MKKTAKIYIAGHNGLVGTSLVRKLQAEGYTNLVFRDHEELDLRRQGNVEKFFREERPEYVFLAAAKVGGILANSTYKAEFIYDNVMISSNVIHSSYRYGVKKLLNLGSACIYPRDTTQPMKEEYLLTGPLESTNEPYAISKITALKLCKYYNEQYGTNFISVMPANLYGPGDNFNLKTSHVLAAFIRKCHLARLLSEEKYDEIVKDFQRFRNGPNLESPVIPTEESEANEAEGSKNLDLEQINKHLSRLGISADSVTLWGSGKPYREFLYVDDLVDAGLFVMRNCSHQEIGEFINIGSGNDIKIKDLSELVKNVTGFNGAIFWDDSKPDGMPRRILDILRIEALGWQAKVSLEEGIKKTYEWYIKKQY